MKVNTCFADVGGQIKKNAFSSNTIARVDGCCRYDTGRVAVIHALDIIYSIRPMNVTIATIDPHAHSTG